MIHTIIMQMTTRNDWLKDLKANRELSSHKKFPQTKRKINSSVFLEISALN